MTGTQPIPIPFCKQGRNALNPSKPAVNNQLRRTTTPLEQETVLPEHADPEPTPTTEMGLQVRPIRPLMSLASIPRALRMAMPEAD